MAQCSVLADWSRDFMNAFKSLIVALVGLVSFIYLINPTAGFFELIPDYVPLFGNLDEAAATVLLINCLAYFGLDLRHLLHRTPQQKPAEPPTITVATSPRQESRPA
jgi:hypothetical protein